MSMYDTFKTDPNLEKDGVWTEFGDYRIKIAHTGGANKAFTKLTQQTFKPYQRQIKSGDMDADLMNRLSKKVAAKTIVTGWQVAKKDEDGDIVIAEDGLPEWEDGIPAEDGGVMEFTPENVLMVFNKLPHLYDEVLNISSEITAYRVAVREDASGNS